MIRFEHVTRRYEPGGRPALDDVTVEFNRGDFVFLIGASGSGKSTLLRMILREGLPQRGKITVAGQNLRLMLERRVPDYRRSIGMVFQDFRLLPDKTVFDNVAFAMRVIGSRRSQVRQRVTKVLERVELDHLARRYPHEISGGEQQRAAIARAIVNEPAILLADEPTGNLDPRASDEVMKILRWISVSGTTVIMATHDRAIVDRMRRRVVQLHDGGLVRDDQRGTYDPPQGSHAASILQEQESSGGLRISDPRPAPSPAPHTVTADAARSAIAKPAATGHSAGEVAVAAVERSGQDTDAAVHDDSPTERKPTEREPVQPEPREPEPQEEDPSEEGFHITWPEHLQPASVGSSIPEPSGDFDGAEMPDLDRDGYTESDLGGAAPAPSGSQESHRDGAEPAALRNAIRQAVASHTTQSAGPEGTGEKSRLSWLAHADDTPVDRRGEASPPPRSGSAEARREEIEDQRLAEVDSTDEPPGHEPTFTPDAGSGPQADASDADQDAGQDAGRPAGHEKSTDGAPQPRSLWRRLRRSR